MHGCRYVRQRETVLIAERLGCQACVLFCGLHAARAQGGAEVAHAWPGAILGDVMASVLQLMHLLIGFQVGKIARSAQDGRKNCTVCTSTLKAFFLRAFLSSLAA